MARKKLKDKSFSRRLCRIRKQKGLSQIELAKAIGSTQRALSYYENAFGYPPLPVIAKLAKALKVNSDVLIGLKPFKGTGKDDSKTQRAWKKFQQMLKLPEKDQRAIIRMINSLSKGK